MKYVVFMSLWPCTIEIWFPTDLGRENSAIDFLASSSSLKTENTGKPA